MVRNPSKARAVKIPKSLITTDWQSVVADPQIDLVAELIDRDYSGRFKDESKRASDSRLVLSQERSLGSVIKLLTPASRDFTPEYNAWLQSIPQYIKELVCVVKRFYKALWSGGLAARARLAPQSVAALRGHAN